MALTCKNCGGNINFDINTKIMTCESCGSSQSINTVVGENDSIYTSNEDSENIDTYRNALNLMTSATEIGGLKTAKMLFESIPDTLNSRSLSKECEEKITLLKTETQYQKALLDMQSEDADTIALAQNVFEALQDYKDSMSKKEECNSLIEKARVLQAEKVKKEQQQARRRRFKRRIISVILIIFLIIGLLVNNYIYSASRYEIEITPTIKNYLTERGNNYEFCYDVKVENNGLIDITALECSVIIQKDDDVITDTTISFDNYSSVAVRAQKNARFTWNLTTNSQYVAEQLYYNFDDLDLEIKITKIKFKNGKIKTY